MNARTLLAAALVLSAAGAARAQIQRFEVIPPEGVVLSGPQRLQPAQIGPRYKVVPVRPIAGLVPWDQLQAKPPQHVFRLDRQRRHERDKELGQRQGGTLLRGALTEFLYKNQRKKAEGR